jgi:hypothetical protein
VIIVAAALLVLVGFLIGFGYSVRARISRRRREEYRRRHPERYGKFWPVPDGFWPRLIIRRQPGCSAPSPRRLSRCVR